MMFLLALIWVLRADRLAQENEAWTAGPIPPRSTTAYNREASLPDL